MIEGEYKGMVCLLTYEAFYYCTPLYNYLNTKYAQCWCSTTFCAALLASKPALQPACTQPPSSC